MTYLIPVLFAASGLLEVQCWIQQTVCEGDPTVFSWPSVDLLPGERVTQYKLFKKGQGTIAKESHSDPRFTYVPNKHWFLKSAAHSDTGHYYIKLDIGGDGGRAWRSCTKNITLVVARSPVFNFDGKIYIWPSGKPKLKTRGAQTGLYLKLSCGHFEDRGYPPVTVEWKKPDGHLFPRDNMFFDNKAFYVWIPAPVTPGLYSCYINPASPAYSCLSRDALSKLKDGAFFDLTEAIIHDISRAPPIFGHHVRYSAGDVEAELARLRARVQELEGQVQQLTTRNAQLQREKAQSDTYTEQLERSLTNVVRLLPKDTQQKLPQSLEGIATLTWTSVNDDWPMPITLRSEVTTCQDVRTKYPESGMRALSSATFNANVYCDQDTDDGGWTVIQRRQSVGVSFKRGWDEYKNGFGNPDSDVWLGLEKIYRITTSASFTLRVDLWSYDNQTAYAQYDRFRVEGEATKYKLHIRGYNGTAGDSLTTLDGASFSTSDRDNDIFIYHCADKLKGAWWYSDCLGQSTQSNLNGHYFGYNATRTDGVFWKSWKGYMSMKKTEMKIRMAG